MTQEAVPFRPGEALRAPLVTRPGASLAASVPLLGSAVGAVGRRPLAAVIWVLALLLVPVLGLVWGGVFTLIGWVSARERLKKEGLVALGEALAPPVARAQLDGGLFRGLWRFHKLSLSVALVQLPAMVLAFAPAAIVYALLMPVQAALPAIEGRVVAAVIPGLLGFGALVVIAAQQLVLLRVLAASGPDYSIGAVFRAAGAAWAVALADLGLLAGVALGALAACLAAGGLIGLSAWLGSLLALGGASMVILVWTAALAVVSVSAVLLEALASWAAAAAVVPVRDPAAFSFSRWASQWIASITTFLSSRGVRGGIVLLCSAAAIFTAGAAIVSGQNFTSWVGLGWFTVSAGLLVLLDRRSGRKE